MVTARGLVRGCATLGQKKKTLCTGGFEVLNNIADSFSLASWEPFSRISTETKDCTCAEERARPYRKDKQMPEKASSQVEDGNA